MTKNSDFKTLIRERMTTTGENYTAARAALLTERLLAPGQSADANRCHADEPSPALDPGVEAALQKFRTRTRRTFVRDGRLTAIPTKRRALVVLLLDIRDTFDASRIYPETEINAHLKQFHPDFARLRRELVDYRYLERNAHTGDYRLAAALPERRGNLLEEAGMLEQLPR